LQYPDQIQGYSYPVDGTPNFLGLNLYGSVGEITLQFEPLADFGSVMTIGVCSGQPPSNVQSPCQEQELPGEDSIATFYEQPNVDGPFENSTEREFSFAIVVQSGSGLDLGELGNESEIEPEGGWPSDGGGDDQEGEAAATSGCSGGAVLDSEVSEPGEELEDEDPVEAGPVIGDLLMQVSWYGSVNLGTPYPWGKYDSSNDGSGYPAFAGLVQ
jgi:hypothetical protein